MDIDVYDIALPPGSPLKNKYVIQQVYHWGHTGILYLAEDGDTKEIVAIKEYCPYFYANRDMDGTSVICKGKRYQYAYHNARAAFCQECEIVKGLRDLKETRQGRILRYRDDFSENNTIYLVTEFIQGMSLDEMLDKEVNFPLRQSMYTLVKTVRALHKQGIYHRDIKPSNLIFRENGTMVLIDFGSACYKNHQNHQVGFVSRGYSAPELYTKERCSKATDIYSIGALFYYLLTGILLTGAEERIKGQPVQPINEIVKVPKLMEYMVEKSICLKPEERWKSLWLMEQLLR